MTTEKQPVIMNAKKRARLEAEKAALEASQNTTVENPNVESSNASSAQIEAATQTTVETLGVPASEIIANRAGIKSENTAPPVRIPKDMHDKVDS